MESQIPLPTDNIYKFYALFGLLLFVFSVGSDLYVLRSINEFAYQAIPEIEAVKQMANPSGVDVARRVVLEKHLEIAVADRKFFDKALGTIGGVALLLMYYGFRKWHKEVQPVQDEMAELQLKKLRHEVGLLTPPPAPPVPPAESPRKESAKPEAED